MPIFSGKNDGGRRFDCIANRYFPKDAQPPIPLENTRLVDETRNYVRLGRTNPLYPLATYFPTVFNPHKLHLSKRAHIAGSLSSLIHPEFPNRTVSSLAPFSMRSGVFSYHNLRPAQMHYLIPSSQGVSRSS